MSNQSNLKSSSKFRGLIKTENTKVDVSRKWKNGSIKLKWHFSKIILSCIGISLTWTNQSAPMPIQYWACTNFAKISPQTNQSNYLQINHLNRYFISFLFEMSDVGPPIWFGIQAFSDFDSSTSDAKIPPCSINFAGVSYSATFPLSNTEINHVTKFF